MLLKGKKIVLGVTGGIAVYKAVDLVSRLRKQGAEVRVVMTEHARQFVTPLTFKEISGNAVATSMWNSNQEFNVEHIALANWADVFVVAPATANIIAKMAHGLADDLLSTTLLAAQAPIIVCPAMIPRGTHVSCRFRYSVIASLTISRKDFPFLMARYFILVWMLLLIRKLQCTGTSVVSETDSCVVGMASVAICSFVGFFVEERSPLRPPFIPSFNILLLLMTMLF